MTQPDSVPTVSDQSEIPLPALQAAGIGGQLLGMHVPAVSGAAQGGLDLGAIVAQIAGGGVGGAMSSNG